jgi:hypothetical protein
MQSYRTLNKHLTTFNFFSFLVFETGSCCGTQAALQLLIPLPQPAECWLRLQTCAPHQALSVP